MSYNRLTDKIALYYKLAQYGDRKTFLRAVAQQPSLSGPASPTPGAPGTAGGRPLTLSEKLKGQPDKVQTLQEYTPPNENLPVINVEDLPKTRQAPVFSQATKDLQDQLNQLLLPTGSIAPLKLDGILGDNTRKAMKAFQTKFNLPATPANVKATLLKEHNLGLETKAPF